ncbi:MAG: hypothetical protein U0556_13010 [Dehalococcoidia bacterium]
MRPDLIPPRLSLSALVGAVLVASYLIAIQGPAAIVVPGLLLIAVVVLAAIARALAGALAAVGAALVYLGLVFIVTPFADLRFSASTGAAIGFALTGVFAALFAYQLSSLERDLDRADLLIDELTLRDPVTGTIKPQFARQELADEVARARRYRRPFSVVMIGVSEQSPPPPDVDLESVFTEVGRALVDRLRATDKISMLANPPRFMLILAETPLDGAKIIADRLVEETRVGTGVQFCSGIAAFPDDSVDPDGLIGEAESALQFASLTDERIAYRDLLRQGV